MTPTTPVPQKKIVDICKLQFPLIFFGFDVVHLFKSSLLFLRRFKVISDAQKLSRIIITQKFEFVDASYVNNAHESCSS